MNFAHFAPAPSFRATYQGAIEAPLMLRCESYLCAKA
jgi:hypothetical protein